jgi:hypothetical protein
LPVNDDAVAADSAAVLGPLAPPASANRDHASLDLGVLGLAPQGDQLRIALARLDDQHPLAVAEGSGCGANPDVSGIATVSLFARAFGPSELLAVPR